MLYIIKLKNGLAIVRAKGHEGSTSMPESHVWQYMKETARIAKEDGITISWQIQEG